MIPDEQKRKRREKYNSVSGEEKQIRKEKRHITEQKAKEKWTPEKLVEYQRKNREKWEKWGQRQSPEKKEQTRKKSYVNKKKRYDNLSPSKKEVILERMSRYSKIRNAERKRKLIFHYSNGLMCCMNHHCEVPNGAKDIRVLTLDHINGGGKKQERELRRKGINFYDWLIKNNFPEEMKGQLQVLCHNCQEIKRQENKECPHRKKLVYVV